MKTRLLTSVGFLFVLIMAIILKVFVSNYFMDALILLITCFASYEASKILSKMGKFNDKTMAILFPCFSMLVLLFGLAYDSTLGILLTIGIVVSLIVVFFGITFLISFLMPNTKFELKTRKLDMHLTKSRYSLIKALNTTILFVYPGFLLLFLTLINHIEDLTTSIPSVAGFNGNLSLIIILFALLIPIFTDTFAYITGGLFGGKKLAPKISPNKTISGAVGGFLWCILLSVMTYYILYSIPSVANILNATGFAVWKLIIIVMIGSVLSQLGDLFESWLKRKANVKYSWNSLPCHGGMLDRFDSYIFVAPYLFIAFSILFAVI